MISQRGPKGAEGHRVFLPLATLLAALPTLADIPVRYDHQVIGRGVCGVFSNTWHSDLLLHTHLDRAGWPDLVAEVRTQARTLAFAYEIGDVQVKDTHAEIWEVTQCRFTGVRILPEEDIA